MARIWAIAILALTASVGLSQDNAVKPKEKEKPKNLEFKGTFADTDPKDEQRGGPSQTHVIKMKAGQVYTIDMISSDLASYLRLLDSKNKQLDEDDDSGGMLNSRIIFNCAKDGDYKVVCTTFGANMTGNYVLTVKTAAGNQKPTTGHALMIDKEAPDFKGDFAINGEPVKLSDLKGKVVLLGFWEVRSGASAAMLPLLAEWHKAYKDDGLVILGVTFYTSEIGQKLGFDKDSGRVTSVKEADQKSDQVLLRDYAGHHKIDHLLMALAKEDALRAFDAYAVNSLPQMVLVDRKGMIRMIQVGGLKSGSDIEVELKKLMSGK
jgi:thiol-disulfide isomerase/thioredoxin